MNVALAIEVASIDHISEANMVGARQPPPRPACGRAQPADAAAPAPRRSIP